jgi:3-dehydroquinate synthase
MTPMTGQRIVVPLGERSYEILVEPGASRSLGERLKRLVDTAKIGIVTDRHVASHYLKPTLDSLKQAKFDPVPIVLPPGERTKTLATVARILDVLAVHRFERRSLLLALGGGVVGDLTGFAASIYQRGIPYVQSRRLWWHRWIPASVEKRGLIIVSARTSSGHSINPRL